MNYVVIFILVIALESLPATLGFIIRINYSINEQLLDQMLECSTLLIENELRNTGGQIAPSEARPNIILYTSKFSDKMIFGKDIHRKYCMFHWNEWYYRDHRYQIDKTCKYASTPHESVIEKCFRNDHHQIIIVRSINELISTFFYYYQHSFFNENKLFILASLEEFTDRQLTESLTSVLLEVYGITNFMVLRPQRRINSIQVLKFSTDQEKCGTKFTIGHCITRSGQKIDAALIRQVLSSKNIKSDHLFKEVKNSRLQRQASADNDLEKPICPIVAVINFKNNTQNHIFKFFYDTIKPVSGLNFSENLNSERSANGKYYLKTGIFIGSRTDNALARYMTNLQMSYVCAEYFIALVPKSKHLSRWECLMAIFTADFWRFSIFIFVLTVLSNETLNILAKKWTQQFSHELLKPLDFLGILVGLSAPSTPSLLKNRFLLLGWLLLCMHFIIAFQARYFDLLQNPPYKRQLLDLDELQNANITIDHYGFHTSVKRYRGGKSLELKPKQIDDLTYASFKDGKHALLVIYNLLYQLDLTKFKHPMVTDFNRKYVMILSSFVSISRNAPYLRIVSLWILRAQASGYYEKFYRDVWSGSGNVRYLRAAAEETEPFPLSLTYFEVPFQIWLAGLIFAGGILFLEINTKKKY